MTEEELSWMDSMPPSDIDFPVYNDKIKGIMKISEIVKVNNNLPTVNGPVEVFSAKKLSRLALDKPIRLIATTLLLEHLYLPFDEPLSRKLSVVIKFLLHFKCR